MNYVEAYGRQVIIDSGDESNIINSGNYLANGTSRLSLSRSMTEPNNFIFFKFYFGSPEMFVLSLLASSVGTVMFLGLYISLDNDIRNVPSLFHSSVDQLRSKETTRHNKTHDYIWA